MWIQGTLVTSEYLLIYPLMNRWQLVKKHNEEHTSTPKYSMQQYVLYPLISNLGERQGVRSVPLLILSPGTNGVALPRLCFFTCSNWWLSNAPTIWWRSNALGSGVARLFFDDVMGEEAWNSWGESLQHCTRWWFQVFFIFTPNYLGKWSNLTNIFQLGWNHQLVHQSRLRQGWISMYPYSPCLDFWSKWITLR